MKLEVVTKINDRQTVTAVFDEAKISAALLQANALLSYKGECGCCHKKNITLQTKIAKDYQFVEFVCGDCGARAQWGAYKKGGCFLKQWEKYERNGGESSAVEKDEDLGF
jgi:ribosomal protein L40E